MRKKIVLSFAAIVAVIALAMTSGCLEDVKNLGEREYYVCPLVGDTEPIGDTKYFLELKEARTFASGPPNFGRAEAVIAVYYGHRAISKNKIEQRRILIDNSILVDNPIEIGELSITLDYVDEKDKYAAFTIKISNTEIEIDIAPVFEAGKTAKKVAEGIIEPTSPSP